MFVLFGQTSDIYFGNTGAEDFVSIYVSNVIASYFSQLGRFLASTLENTVTGRVFRVFRCIFRCVMVFATWSFCGQHIGEYGDGAGLSSV